MRGTLRTFPPPSHSSRGRTNPWGGRRRVRDAHAALVVGVEGYQQKRAFRPHALLLLDPAGTEPTLFAYNARVVFDHKRPSFMTETDAYPVTFNTAVSIHPITRAAPAVILDGCA